jgi:RHS repeat-associated protein
MKVYMSTTTPGSPTIFYTVSNTDPAPDPTHTGSTPGSGTNVYSGPVNVLAGVHKFFRAIVYEAGYGDSTPSDFDADNTNTGGGMMMMSSSQSTTTIFSVWDGDWAILEEYTTNNSLVEKYLQGYHGLVKTFVQNVYYYQDELGSTSHIADTIGALIESYQYDVYGKPRVYNSSGVYQAGATPRAQFLQGGARWMSEIGLYDDRNRFMSPDLGRFIQPDPIGFKGDASNLYRYSHNDWANTTDPLGTQDGRGSLDDQTSLNGKETDSALRKNNQNPGDNHGFQSKWGGEEVKSQANVDSQHAQNMKNGRAEANQAAALEEAKAAMNPASAQALTPQKMAYSKAKDALEKWEKDHLSVDLNINGPGKVGGNLGVDSKGVYVNGGIGPGAGAEATVTMNVNFGGTARGYGVPPKYWSIGGAIGNPYPPFFPAFRANLGHSPEGGWSLSLGGGIGPAVYGGTTILGGGGYIYTWGH